MSTAAGQAIARPLPLDEAAAFAVDAFHAAGCEGSAIAARSDGWKIEVREGRRELMKSTTTQGLQLSAFAGGGRHGSTSTSDLSAEGVRAAAATAVELAQVADPDQWAALPPPGECGLAGGDLAIDDPDWTGFTPERCVELVAAGEAAARAHDPRVKLSDRCSGSASRWTRVLASTAGVRIATSGTSFGYNVMAVAMQGDERQMGWDGTGGRHWRALRSPAEVGRRAGERAVESFGWSRAPSGAVPVVLDRDTASEFLGILAWSLGGAEVYRKRTWCADSLGKELASGIVEITDDPLIPRAPGSRGCDHEGVRARRLAVVERGRLATFLCDGYAARRLGHPYTGHKSGASNFRLAPGAASRDDLLREMKRGLLVTSFNGWGVDLTSGTFSRGAAGFWVEDGRIAHPVQEITIAGKLPELWRGVRAVANDPDPEHATASPSLLIDGFTVGGA